MRIANEPRVYLIARSTLTPGVERFLEDNGLGWPTEPIERPSNIFDSVPSDAEQLTELAGRCCYMSFGQKAGSRTNAAYLENLIGGGPLGRSPEEILADLDAVPDESGMVGDGRGTYAAQRAELRDELRASLAQRRRPAHGSVLEHATFSFIVTGAGRGFSHEQVRHRAGWAYSQLSTRYCDFERSEATEGTWEPGFTVPPLARLTALTRRAFENAHDAALTMYRSALGQVEQDLVERPEFATELAKLPERERKRALRKAARGAARDLLPNGTEAIMVMSANARAIWNTIALRATPEAEAEIRAVYVQIARIMEKEMPSVFRGLRYVPVWDGSEAVVMPRDKI